MLKNKNYVVYSEVDGKIVAALSSPVVPFIEVNQNYVEGTCVDIHTCVVDLNTLEIKEIT